MTSPPSKLMSTRSLFCKSEIFEVELDVANLLVLERSFRFRHTLLSKVAVSTRLATCNIGLSRSHTVVPAVPTFSLACSERSVASNLLTLFFSSSDRRLLQFFSSDWQSNLSHGSWCFDPPVLLPVEFSMFLSPSKLKSAVCFQLSPIATFVRFAFFITSNLLLALFWVLLTVEFEIELLISTDMLSRGSWIWIVSSWV